MVPILLCSCRFFAALVQSLLSNRSPNHIILPTPTYKHYEHAWNICLLLGNSRLLQICVCVWGGGGGGVLHSIVLLKRITRHRWGLCPWVFPNWILKKLFSLFVFHQRKLLLPDPWRETKTKITSTNESLPLPRPRELVCDPWSPSRDKCQFFIALCVALFQLASSDHHFFSWWCHFVFYIAGLCDPDTQRQ
jgi:hypothetical protein